MNLLILRKKSRAARAWVNSCSKVVNHRKWRIIKILRINPDPKPIVRGTQSSWLLKTATNAAYKPMAEPGMRKSEIKENRNFISVCVDAYPHLPFEYKAGPHRSGRDQDPVGFQFSDLAFDPKIA